MSYADNDRRIRPRRWTDIFLILTIEWNALLCLFTPAHFVDSILEDFAAPVQPEQTVGSGMTSINVLRCVTTCATSQRLVKRPSRHPLYIVLCDSYA